MLIKSLPADYRQLVELRRSKDRDNAARVGTAFTWKETPEGSGFWSDVAHAESEKELPAIPNKSLREIANPQLWR